MSAIWVTARSVGGCRTIARGRGLRKASRRAFTGWHGHPPDLHLPVRDALVAPLLTAAGESLSVPTTKAVILARGLGTRMRRADAAAALDDTQSSAADSGLKGMIPIGRPFLDYVISALAEFRSFCHIVHQVSPEF